MKYLLDTAVWLWSVSTPEKIGRRGREIFLDPGQELFLSAVTPWELAIKAKLGKYELPEALPEYVPKRLASQRIRPLAISQLHALATYDLPLHHYDPFDRMLIAQAIVEKMIVLTSDRHFGKYEIDVVWCGS